LKQYVKRLLVVCFFLTSFTVFGQSYLGTVTQAANLREGPGTNYPVLETLPAGRQVFIYSAEGENDFYKVKVIRTDTDGYISKSLVALGDVLEEAKEDEIFLNLSGRTQGDPRLTITNNTSVRLTFTLNSDKYIFAPQETKTLTVPAGRYRYMASAPLVIPDFGTTNLENNIAYTWVFYLQ
jgi:uncharacterized protein YgiM (DUF1202 family)